jgi:hypothetical protein
MAITNTVLPVEERTLTPQEVQALDHRRRMGHLFIVMAGQFLLISIFVTLWTGQDLTYSPGWAHPMAYWDALLFVVSMIFLVRGLAMRRGVNEFFSY